MFRKKLFSIILVYFFVFFIFNKDVFSKCHMWEGYYGGLNCDEDPNNPCLFGQYCRFAPSCDCYYPVRAVGYLTTANITPLPTLSRGSYTLQYSSSNEQTDQRITLLRDSGEKHKTSSYETKWWNYTNVDEMNNTTYTFSIIEGSDPGTFCRWALWQTEKIENKCQLSLKKLGDSCQTPPLNLNSTISECDEDPDWHNHVGFYFIPCAVATPATSPPTNLSGSCSIIDNQPIVNLNWSEVLERKYYALRVNNTSDSWDGSCDSPSGDFCENLTENKHSFTGQFGATYDWWVSAVDYCNNWYHSNHALVNCPTPTPTLYPTIIITGVLKEKKGSNCQTGVANNNISLNLIPQNNQGISTNCGVTPPYGSTYSSSYSCRIIFDNQNFQPTPKQDFRLNANNPGYNNIYWPQDNNNCQSLSMETILIDAVFGPYLHNKDIFFEFDSSWIKIKDTSFSRNDNFINYIPAHVSVFDSEDQISRYFIIGSAGLGLAHNFDFGNAVISSLPQWQIENYQINDLDLEHFIDYIKARKKYKNVSGPESINENGIYFLDEVSAIDNSFLNEMTANKVLLISTGDIEITGESFNIANDCNSLTNTKSLAVLTKQQLVFSNNLKCAAGIFISNTFDTGRNENQGLKIKGNLVVSVPITNRRKWFNNSQPSFFVVFYPTFYFDLLPWLSTSIYDWRELAP